MKSFQYAIPALACALYGLAGLPTFSQSPTPDPVPLPPEAVAEGIDLPPPPVPAGPARFAQAAQTTQSAQAAQEAFDAFVFSADGHTLGGATWPAGEHFNLNENGGLNYFNYSSGASKPRTLVIRSGETDPKTLSALEEDLNVMSRILAKATREKASDDDAVTAMGMRIRTLSVGGNSSVENLYLDAYGALFMLHVRFPLLPPPEPAKEEARQESTDSTWDEARRELYGPKKSSGAVKGNLFLKDRQREAYDAKKVAQLKEVLVDALKNAANIRNLKADEHITIVVLGRDNAPGTRVVNIIKRAGADVNDSARVHEYATASTPPGVGSTITTTDSARVYTTARAGAVAKAGPPVIEWERGSTTTLTIRAKKSDVDAFAKGTLKPEDFQKKVAITTY